MKKYIKPAPIAVIVVVGLIISLIYFRQKNNSVALLGNTSSLDSAPDEPIWDYNLNLIVKDLLDSASTPVDLKVLHQSLGEGSDSVLLRQIANGWKKEGHQLVSGYYFEKLAGITSIENDWLAAAESYFDIQDRVNDTVFKPELIRHSIHCFENVLSQNPDNLSAKADLAVSLMELGEGPPMRAIGLLKEIEQQDSLNVKGLFYLGIFSMQSQQYDKAIDRFKKLTEIEPANPVYSQYLGEAYLYKGEEENAVLAFEKHISLLKDPDAIQDAKIRLNRLITELKK